MIQQFNAVHASLNEEISDLRDGISSTEVNDSRGNYVYTDGSVALPVRQNEEYRMIGESEVFNSSLITYTRYIGETGSYVDDSGILKIPAANKKLLAVYANMMVQEENRGRFYGMIVVDGDRKINPMHPVIAAMIAAREIRLSDTFTIIMYPYQEQKSINTDFSEKYSKEIVEMLSSIRNEQYLPSISYAPTNSLDNDIRAMVSDVNGVSITFRSNGDRINDVIIPVQLATTSIVYPFYGLIHSSNNGGGSYTSNHLYPCLSGNIDTMSTGRGQTCVGSLNNYSFSSLYVLSNMNIRSMYFSEVFSAASDNFIAACQSVSAEFIAAAAGMSFDEDSNDSNEESNDESNNSIPVEEEQAREESCEPCAV